MSTVVVSGGSNGLGRYIALRYADRGDNVIITSRRSDRACEVAAEMGGRTLGLKLDLSKPLTLADALSDISSVDDLIVTASSQHVNSLREFDIEEAVRAVTIKLVGYTESCALCVIGSTMEHRLCSSVVLRRTSRTQVRQSSQLSTVASAVL